MAQGPDTIVLTPYLSSMESQQGEAPQLHLGGSSNSSAQPLQPEHEDGAKPPARIGHGYLREKWPKSYTATRKVLLYLRGPRPKVSLPGPVPLLDRTYNVRGKPFTLQLESLVLRYTSKATYLWLFCILAIGYVISLGFFARANWFYTPREAFIDCTDSYWRPLDGCGLDGSGCSPFSDATFEFRCPARCRDVVLANPRTIGLEAVQYVPLVVGGGDTNRTYRGDSFLCASALHAGLITNSRGGCAAVQLVGSYSNFLGSSANEIVSTSFPSIFPLSFQLASSKVLSHCQDLRNEALAFNILCTVILFLILRPRPVLLFWSLVCIGFWHITLFSDPLVPPQLSTSFGRFLPALFVCYAFWRAAFRRTLPAFSQLPLERLIWYLPMFWTGCLFNILVEKVPVDRLLLADISGRPGALATVVVVTLVLFVLILNQAREIRKTGWLGHYVGWYALGALALLVLALLPTLQFRLHHYFAAIILIPITAFPTRLSAIYQAFLLGMFLQGIARWGFDPILQTAEELRRDAPLGSSLPLFSTNSTNWNASVPVLDQMLRWTSPPDNGEGWNGFSLLVDDVQRYAGSETNFSLAGLEAGLVHFFRLAYQKDGQSGDFTKAAVLAVDRLTFSDPAEGPS